MRIPLAANLESRDGTLDQDAIVKNGIIESRGADLPPRLRKRPGLASFHALPTAGTAQALFGGDNLLAVVSDKLCWIGSHTGNYMDSTLKGSNITLTNEGRTVSASAAGSVYANLLDNEGGLAYAEVTIGSASDAQRIGVGFYQLADINGAPGASAAVAAYDASDGIIYANSATVNATGVTATTGDVIGVAVYLDRATSTSHYGIKWFKNGVLLYEKTPAATVYQQLSQDLRIVLGAAAAGGDMTVNFGKSAFSYVIPTNLECAISPTTASRRKWWVAETGPAASTRYLFLHNGLEEYTALAYPAYGSGAFTVVANIAGPYAGGIAYLDGYFFVMDEECKISNSASENPTSFGALDFVYADAYPGRGVYIGRTLTYIVALKESSCEWFYDAGNPTGSVLSAITTSAKQIGCADRYSVADVADSLMFIGRETSGKIGVYRLRGLELQKVSTPDVDRVLELSTLADNDAFATTVDGGGLYVLTLGDLGVTIVYQEAVDRWVQWSSLTAAANKTVSTITRSSTTATMNTSTAHGMSDGDPVTIAGANEAAFNGLFQISYVDTDTFTVEVTVTTLSVNSITRSGTTATVTTASAHGYTSGQKVTIAGATQTDYNGTYTITSTGADTYTYTVANSPATPATGTITSTTPGEAGSGTITATPYTEGEFAPKAAAAFQNYNLVLAGSTSLVSSLAPATYLDAAVPINFFARTPRLDGGTTDRKKLARIGVIGTDVSDTAMLRFSDDDSSTFTAYRRVNLADEEPELRRCGAFSRRSIEFRHIGNTAPVIDALEIDIGR